MSLLTMILFGLNMPKPQTVFTPSAASNLHSPNTMNSATDSVPFPRKSINWKQSAGMRFGRWTVIQHVGNHPSSGLSILRCRCDCGNEKEIRSCYLFRGESKSCGCLSVEKTVERSTKHGLSPRGNVSNFFTLYHDILRRCRRHPRYAGRGIVMCDRWLNGENGVDGLTLFAQDMGKRPTNKHTVERVNNDGPYSPENCVWGTRFDQSNNRCDTRLVTYNGETMSLSRWAKKTGISRTALASRYDDKWPAERMLTTPVKNKMNAEEFDWG